MKKNTFTLVLLAFANFIFAQSESPSLVAEVSTVNSNFLNAHGFLNVSITASEEEDYPIRLYVGSTLVSLVMSDEFSIGMKPGQLNNVQLLTADGESHDYGDLVIEQFFTDGVEAEYPVSICENQSTQLLGPNGYATYQWGTGETTPSIEVSPSLSGVYLVEVLDENGNDAGFVYPVNVLHFDVHYFNYEDMDCDGAAEMMLEIFTNDLDAYPITITAEKEGELISLNAAEQSSASVFLSVGTYTNLSFETANGCINNTGEIVVSQSGNCETNTEVGATITSNQVTIESNTAVLCDNADLVLSITGADNLDWTWTGPQGFTATGSEVEVSGIDLGKSGDYRAEALDASGNIIQELFNLSVVELGVNMVSCNPLDAIFNLPQGLEYIWSDGTEGPNYSAQISESTTLTVSAMDVFGCTISDEISFAIGEGDNEPINMEPIALCAEAILDITAPDGYLSYQWSTGSTSQTIAPDLQPNSTYWVDAYDEFSCVQRYIYNVDIVTFFAVLPIPTGESKSCATGQVEFQVVTGADGIYPVEIGYFQSQEWTTLAVLTESSTELEFEVGTYNGVYAYGQGSCDIEALNFTVVSTFEYGETTMDPIGICPDQPVTITAPDGYVSYQWGLGNTSQSLTAYPQPGNVYWVEGTDENGCVQRFNYEFEFASPTAVSFIPTGVATQCATSGVEIQAVTQSESEYPVTITGVIDGESVAIAEITEASTTVEISIGLYEDIQIVNNEGCKSSAEDFELVPSYRLDEIDMEQLSICIGESYNFEAPAGYQSYLWSTGDDGQFLQEDAIPGLIYWVDCVDNEGCIQRFNFSLDVLEPTSVYILPQEESSSCLVADVEIQTPAMSEDDYPITVIGELEGEDVTIAELNEPIATVQLAGGVYTNVQATNQYGCTFMIPDFEATVQSIISDELYATQIVCPNAGVTLSAPEGFENYLWNTGQDTPSFFTLPSPGDEYYVDCSNEDGCIQRFNYEFDFITQFEVNVESVTLDGNCQEGGMEVTVETDNEIVYPIELTADYNSQRIAIGMVYSEIETVILPVGEYINVFAKSSNGCSYQTGDLNIISGASSEPIFLEATALCEGVEFNLQAPEGFISYVWNNGSTDTSIFAQASTESTVYYVDCNDGEGCAQRYYYPVDIVTLFELALFETDQTQGCEFAMVETFISTDNNAVFPVQIEATIDGEATIVGTVNSANGLIFLAPGMYDSIRAIGNAGCDDTVVEYEVIIETFSAAVNLIEATDPCNPGFVQIDVTNASPADYPMNFTAFDPSIGDWFQIGVVNSESETFELAPGLYLDVELKDQNNCILELNDISLNPFPMPCDQSPQGRIASRVFFDSNYNGIRDEDEPGVRDVIVTAVNDEGEIVAVEISNNDGSYAIEDLPADDYFLHFNLPSSMSETSPNVGDDENIDSDIDHSNGIATTAFFNVNSHETVSTVGAGVGGIVLPLEWGFVKAKNLGDTNEVTWSTLIEEQTTYFVIERADSENFDFVAIDTVMAEGTAYSQKEYQYLDANIEGLKDAYYRVVSVDILSQVSNTEVVHVEIENVEEISVSVYPNPTTDYIHVKYNEGQEDQDFSVRVIASNGVSQRLSIPESFTVGDRIDLTGLVTGTYVLEVKVGRSIHRENIVFVKQ